MLFLFLFLFCFCFCFCFFFLVYKCFFVTFDYMINLDVKFIRYQFWCTRCIFRQFMPLQWCPGRKKKGNPKCYDCKNTTKFLQIAVKWSQIYRRIELCMMKLTFHFISILGPNKNVDRFPISTDPIKSPLPNKFYCLIWFFFSFVSYMNLLNVSNNSKYI
jgi:hypothetical protein